MPSVCVLLLDVHFRPAVHHGKFLSIISFRAGASWVVSVHLSLGKRKQSNRCNWYLFNDVMIAPNIWLWTPRKHGKLEYWKLVLPSECTVMSLDLKQYKLRVKKLVVWTQNRTSYIPWSITEQRRNDLGAWYRSCTGRKIRRKWKLLLIPKNQV